MKEASFKDRALVVNILAESFREDPHMKWLLEHSKNKNKLKIILDYVFDETMAKGKIYLNDQHNATALWTFRESESITPAFILRNIQFFFRMGLSTTYRVLKYGIVTHREYHQFAPYCFLYLLGVLPEAQGTGQASCLMNFMLEKMDSIHKPVVLETANKANTLIYQKKGFATFKELKMGENTLYLMKRLN